MSFLYQALIKDEPKNQQEQVAQYEQVPPAGFYGQNFAPEQKSSTPLWIVIGALLLIVGILGGFILGQQKKNEPDSLESTTENAAILQALLDAQAKQELESSVQKHAQAQVQNAPLETEKTVQEDETLEPKIEVALTDDGTIKTQVTEQNTTKNDSQSDDSAIDVGRAEESVNVSTNQQTNTPELSLDEIPEELKSSFAEALKATEENVEPNLFESHVSTGSSLALITELPANQMFLLPDIEYQMHIFASEPSERWIRLNGQTLLEGEVFTDDLTLIEIRQEQIIWQYKERRFAQNALEDFVKREHL
jgi:general secretion pathway protein B